VADEGRQREAGDVERNAAGEPRSQQPVIADGRSRVTDTGELVRLGSMLQTMIAEVHEVSLDEPGRERLRAIHDKAVDEIKSVVSPDLARELDALTLPLGEDLPSGAELKIAQAQLFGWLKGLFQGIQASMLAQASQQPGQQQPTGEQPQAGIPGRYL
jgi:hypothetical protein